MKYIITADQLTEIADIHDNTGRERQPLFDCLRTTYSGRSMYGKDCLAYVGNSSGLACFAIAVHAILSEGGDVDFELMDALTEYATDSMGYDQVFYWRSGDLNLDGDAANLLTDN